MSVQDPSLMCYVTSVVALMTLAMLAWTAYASLSPLRGAAWNAAPMAAFVALIGLLHLIRGCGITAAGVSEAMLWIGGSFLVGMLLGGRARLLKSAPGKHAT